MKSTEKPVQSDVISEEGSPLLDCRDIKPYKRRWYVLMVFTYAGVIQATVWNTFGPIAQTAKLVFGWTDANIGMLIIWGNVMYVVFMIPVTWVMDGKGLRVSMLLCTTLVLVAASIRCITSESTTATWLINAACILNGIAGIVPFAGLPLVSATWFPKEQRTTATAISSISSYVGLAVTFIIGPGVVPEPNYTTVNMTDKMPVEISDITNDNVTHSLHMQQQRYGIMRLMYIECGAAVLLFLLVLLYFPAKPPSPPSISASMIRTDYMLGIKQLFRHKRFLLILLAYSIPTGVYGVFVTVLDVILNGIGISQVLEWFLNLTILLISDITNDNVTHSLHMQQQRYGIMRLMYIECGAAVLLFLLVLLYFPAKPPSPPSLSASMIRTDYMLGIKQLFRHKRFLLILLAYSIPTGVYGVFVTVLDVILNGIGISQNTAGWIGFYAAVAGCAAALLMSRIADIFVRRMKALLLFLFVIATVATVWFVILRLRYIPFDIASLHVCIILVGVFTSASVPLFYELGCEVSYPVAEGVTTGALTLMNNMTGIMFLSVLQIPNIGVLWMNWALLGSVAVTIPLLLIFQEKYTRMDIDTATEIIIPPPTSTG